MKLRYMLYQLKCKITHKSTIDFVDFVGITLFIRGGV